MQSLSFPNSLFIPCYQYSHTELPFVWKSVNAIKPSHLETSGLGQILPCVLSKLHEYLTLIKTCNKHGVVYFFQLCVQKLRILIEDSDQNCKYGAFFMELLAPKHWGDAAAASEGL